MNNQWDNDYSILKRNLTAMEKAMAVLKEENVQKIEESAKHEKHIKRLTNKLEMFMNNSVDDKSLWEPDDTATATSPMPSERFSDEEEFPINDFAQPQYQQPLPPLPGVGVGFQRLPNDLSQQENQELKSQNNVSTVKSNWPNKSSL